MIYGLIYIASTAAFNSIINATCLMLNLAYVIPQGILLTQGRAKLPSRTFDLGKWGLPSQSLRGSLPHYHWCHFLPTPNYSNLSELDELVSVLDQLCRGTSN